MTLYAVSEGRVLTWSLETHLTDHCNLRCEHCCTLSPHLPARAVDPAQLERDLCRAAAAVRPQVFKLTGGEPLLHPDLVACVQIVRRSGISDQISLTTNGLLLPRVPEALFGLLDRLTVSVYSSAPLPEMVLATVRERCARNGVLLTVKRIDRFQRLDAEPPFLSAAEAGDVHAACWLRVRCHMIHAGRFYTCTRPPHLQTRLGTLGHHLELSEADGISLDGSGLPGRLRAYLESEEPLASCRYCLGANGPWEPHRQLRGRRLPSGGV